MKRPSNFRCTGKPGLLLAAWTLVVLIVGGVSVRADTGGFLDIGKFSGAAHETDFPPGWHPMLFKKIEAHTRYSLVKDDTTWVLRAQSSGSASGLLKKVVIDPGRYPIIRWRWKITTVFEKGDVTRKAGDDYPARIYITFAYDPDRLGLLEKAKFETARLLYGEYPPGSAITYIWANKAPKGAIVDNPYTDRVKMIVLESGETLKNQWITERRNIYEDYLRSFGSPAPPISGVAVMTDTDNTKSSATSFYGDILFGKDRGNAYDEPSNPPGGGL